MGKATESSCPVIVNTHDKKRFLVLVGLLSENNYHHRIILKRDVVCNTWSQEKEVVVLDTSPVAIPLCTVNDTIQARLRNNGQVFESRNGESYFLNPVFCLWLIKDVLILRSSNLSKAFEDFTECDENGSEVVIRYDFVFCVSQRVTDYDCSSLC
jgi:hypothetical protein